MNRTIIGNVEITYQLTAYVDGQTVYKQIYADTADLQADLDEAEQAVENAIQLGDE